MSSTTYSTGEAGLIIALIPDAFFGITVRNVILRLGYEAALIRDTSELEEACSIATPVLLIVDMTAVREDPDAWAPITEIIDDRGARVVAFGPHREAGLFRAAQQAGVTRVVSNSQFHREMGDLIQRYALFSRAEEDVSAASEQRERPAAERTREEE